MFIGRSKELQQLKRFYKKNVASLVVVKGRRRIGKSTLVEQLAKSEQEKSVFYVFSGLPPTERTTNQSQKDEFALQLGTHMGIPGIKADDWSTLFLLMDKQINKGRVVILLDEISWMGSRDPDFLGKLKNAWDLFLKKNNKLTLVLCGSASSWIEKNIISSTGFLGRISYTLTLEEMSLKECNLFWGKMSSKISNYEKCKFLSVVGGVPRYLEELDPKLSAEENIKNMCFSRGGMLVQEFNNIFSDLFLSQSKFYKETVLTLSGGAKTYKQICHELKIEQSGRMSSYLHELELAGFIKRDYTWDLRTGNESKLSRYRLSDNYLRFYLNYIDKNLSKIESNAFAFKSLSTLPGWESVMGLQFENLVLNNRENLHNLLKIDTNEIVNSNPYYQSKTSARPGCQIDYLIQTRFGSIYVCEIKFSKNPIGISVINEVEKKINALKLPKSMSIRPVLIHINGITSDLEDADYFANIIDFGEVFR